VQLGVDPGRKIPLTARMRPWIAFVAAVIIFALIPIIGLPPFLALPLIGLALVLGAPPDYVADAKVVAPRPPISSSES
jgi:hypothetical protein